VKLVFFIMKSSTFP